MVMYDVDKYMTCVVNEYDLIHTSKLELKSKHIALVDLVSMHHNALKVATAAYDQIGNSSTKKMLDRATTDMEKLNGDIQHALAEYNNSEFILTILSSIKPTEHTMEYIIAYYDMAYKASQEDGNVYLTTILAKLNPREFIVELNSHQTTR